MGNRIVAAEPKDFGVPLTPPEPLDVFAVTLSFGQGGGAQLTDDPATFEKLILNVQRAGYNTIGCAYRDYRLELCRKHNFKLMIDVLAGGDESRMDIRRPEQREKLQKLCEKLQNDKAVWGYCLSNDRLDRFAPGGADNVNECLALLRTWDPIHPVWIGEKSFAALQAVQGTAGVLACADVNGQGNNLTSLTEGFALCQSRVDNLGRSIDSEPDIRRTLQKINASLAHGMKAMIWQGEGAVDPKSGALDEQHRHLSVHREIAKLYHELGEIDRPQAVYSTPTTRTWDDREKPRDVPRPLTPFPATCWAQVIGGEVLVGFFKYDSGFDAVFVANHSARQPQKVTMEVKSAGSAAPRVEIFNRKTGQWDRLSVAGNKFSFELQPGAGELLRLLGVTSD
ncbi:MAG: hypothetical protein K8T91_17285 [Planctomycetes bacterium]|nr:hypothetical protein [Planctomycetota bacterium]